MKVKRLVSSVSGLVLCSLLALSDPQKKEILQSPSGGLLEIAARSIAPGEILSLTLRSPAGVNALRIRFLSKNLRVPLGPGSKNPHVLLGLDLGLSPGRYPLMIGLDFPDGRTDEIQKAILVAGREFPTKKFWVKQEYVTPPQEVQERIERETALLEALYGIITPVWQAEGPFEVPCQGTIYPNFGQRRIYNNVPRSSHSGVDIEAPWGAPILASNSGRVVLASDLYFAGNTVVIDHGLGLYTTYCHLSKILVSRGEKVNKRYPIGKAGSSGRSTGPHLHWSVRLLESRVDPAALLSFPFPAD
jgi:hypothetical protein